MMFPVPDWLRYEIRHGLERLRESLERLRLKDKINDHPKVAAVIVLLFVLLLASALARIVRRTPGPQYRQSKRAWFYDLNTGELFSASSRLVGPVATASGPLPNGEPAGFRAHVYSFVRDPNESERFVAFLEKPDPNATSEELSPDIDNLKEWARGRLIRRVGGDTWISPTSPRGRQIIQELTHPNSYGQTPLYNTPK